MVRKNVAEILTNHVTFELEAIDLDQPVAATHNSSGQDS